MTVSIFMAERMRRAEPFSTVWPSSTLMLSTTPGIGQPEGENEGEGEGEGEEREEG